MIYGILLFCLPLLVLEGFFAASEISLVSANRRRLHHLGPAGHRAARRYQVRVEEEQMENAFVRCPRFSVRRA